MLKASTENILVRVCKTMISAVGGLIGVVIAPITTIPIPGKGLRRESSPPKPESKPEEPKHQEKGRARAR